MVVETEGRGPVLSGELGASRVVSGRRAATGVHHLHRSLPLPRRLVRDVTAQRALRVRFSRQETLAHLGRP